MQFRRTLDKEPVNVTDYMRTQGYTVREPREIGQDPDQLYVAYIAVVSKERDYQVVRLEDWALSPDRGEAPRFRSYVVWQGTSANEAGTESMKLYAQMRDHHDWYRPGTRYRTPRKPVIVRSEDMLQDISRSGADVSTAHRSSQRGGWNVRQ